MTSLNGPTALRNCLWLALFDVALKDIPPQETGLYLCENQGWERAFLHTWRKHGHGVIIGVAHATVPFWHTYYFDDPRSLNPKKVCAMPLPDRLAVNGTAAWNTFADAGFPVEQLAEVEALRYLNLAGIAEKRELVAAKRYKVKPLVSEFPKLNILILGEMNPESMHYFLKLLEDTIKLLPLGYHFTLKPHPGYVANLANYPGLRANETAEALDQILVDYDLVIAANSTSASVDAYISGLPVIIGLDGRDFNLSPLRGQVGVTFVSKPEELAVALRVTSQNKAVDLDRNDFFYLDPELPRWHHLLNIAASKD